MYTNELIIMRKILGLDIGSTSIGWAYIDEAGSKRSIRKLGVRLIPYAGDEQDQFSKGQTITVNKDRTLKRTARKCNHRYKQRRFKLSTYLQQIGAYPEQNLLLKVNALSLYGLRSKGVSEKLSLPELGRVLLHLNQKRGYRSSRTSPAEEGGKKVSDYLQELAERKAAIESRNLTIGQYFHQQLLNNPYFRIREKVFPRDCYIQEYDRIMLAQQRFYPDLLTDERISEIRDEIIFWQRPLKSQKHLVGECTFEKHHKVAPKSSPLFQVEKIWESIHNISIVNKSKEQYVISREQKQWLFEHLNHHEKLTQTELFKILGLNKRDGWIPNEQIRKTGIQGNLTVSLLRKAFKKAGLERPELLQFNLVTEVRQLVDKQTGEVSDLKLISSAFEREPLYLLWHRIYSLSDPHTLQQLLMREYGMDQDQAAVLSALDFTKSGFGSKSARAIRKLLPALMEGDGYAEAAKKAGYNHSNSLTTAENEARPLADRLVHYKRNTLRQPVVEKVLNQLVNLINSIITDNQLGRPDEIRVELARQLKQSREDRQQDYNRNNETDRRHKSIADRIHQEYPGIKVTRKLIEKYKLYEEQGGICMYSGNKMELAMVLRGEGIDVDHIIPRTRLFDDSYQNKVLAFRSENAAKDNRTAYEYMNAKSDDELQQYLERVNRLLEEDRITRSKHKKLLMDGKEIPEDFISRQLNETSYVSREAVKLLKQVCRDVYTTGGSVTAFLREQWGYDEVLRQLNGERYSTLGIDEEAAVSGWSKRDDHRHHAIDALVVAATRQGYIQKLNRLNSDETRSAMLKAIQGRVENGWQARKRLLDQYVQTEQPFTTQEVKQAVSQVLISLKSGKKASAISRNKANDQRSVIPRGQLHKEQVYGKIRRYSEKKIPLNSRFNRLEDIVNETEKALVQARLAAFDLDPKKAFKNLAKDPIWLDAEKTKPLTEVTCWEYFFVYKYTLDQQFKEKDIESIIDAGIREKVRQRFKERAGQKDHPLKNIEQDPIWLNAQKRIPIKSVRCFTGLTDLVPLHHAQQGETLSRSAIKEPAQPTDFVSTRNNHHVALYKTPEGKLEEKMVTLWEAVRRKQLGLPVLIRDVQACWNEVLNKGIDDQSVLANLPDSSWTFYESLSQNEMFVFNLSREEVASCIHQGQLQLINQNLYRVQKIAEVYYVFRHHLETTVDDKKFGGDKNSIDWGKMIRIQSLSRFQSLNPVKVKIDVKGQISLA